MASENEKIEAAQPGDPPHPGMIWIPGGTFRMGSENFYPEERPVHQVAVDGFWMDKYQVTNIQYAHFVDETGYVTVAEQPPDPEDFPGAPPENLVPGSLVFHKTKGPVDLRYYDQWWDWTPGAYWREPQGPGSDIEHRKLHPAVHLAYEDVVAYCEWAGKTLPAEAEWEYAARGGLDGKNFTWGDEDFPNGKAMANSWQGEFPWQNFTKDGFERTSPVGSFPGNGYGLRDMAGNVWEWTEDWWTSAHPDEVEHACCVPQNPRRGQRKDSLDPAQPDFKIPRKVLKGGSHLCAPNYCLRYRPAARHAQMIDSGTTHIGFRCIVRVNGGSSSI
jgi:formylglycine-generating enzyme required for sulfatase activity